MQRLTEVIWISVARMRCPSSSVSNQPSSCCHFLVILSFDPDLHERGQRKMSQAVVAVAALVEHGYLVEQIVNGLVSSRVAQTMLPFILAIVEEAINRCVFAALALTRN